MVVILMIYPQALLLLRQCQNCMDVHHEAKEIQNWEDEVSNGLDHASVYPSPHRRINIGLDCCHRQVNGITDWGTGGTRRIVWSGNAWNHKRFDVLVRVRFGGGASWAESEKGLNDYIDFSTDIFNTGNVSKTSFDHIHFKMV